MNNRTPFQYRLCGAIEREQFETTSLEEEVIKKAKEAGFITDDNSTENQSKLDWVKKVTKHAEDAFNLQAVADGKNIEIQIGNFKELNARRDKQVNDILELLAKHVIDAAPPYKN